MNEFIKRLNKKRLKTLGFFFVVWLFVILSIVSIVFTVSDDVHLEKWITLIPAVVFACLAFGAHRMFYAKAKNNYEKDFKENSLKELFSSVCERVIYKEENEDIAGFVSQSLIDLTENTEYSFCGKYEGIDFRAIFKKSQTGYTGWLFEFTFSKLFKRNVQVRRKGSSLVIPPEKVWEDGFEVYETQSEPFNFRYIVNSPSGVDASVVMCEEVVYSFLSATEKTRARISASFNGNKLYVFLQGVMPSYNIPLLSPVTETRVKKELFSDINAALTLALDLDTEKRIWKRT